MHEFVKDSELIDDDPPFHSSTSPGGPIPDDLRVAGFDKRKTVSDLVDIGSEAIGESAINIPENFTPSNENPVNDK